MSFSEFYQRSINEPEQFWAEQARRIDWQTPFTQTLDHSNPPFARWFCEGRTNLCHNAIDRWLEKQPEALALIAVSSETEEERTFTFRQLHDEVNAVASMLRSLGVQRGDRVLVYMPMIAEAHITLLACARIGAIHSVVFGGFASHSVAARIDDAKPVLIVSADAGARGGKIIPYKKLLDDAISQAQHQPRHVLLVDRGLAKMARVSGRDVDFASLRHQHIGARVPVAWLESNETSCILYTSGTTGFPKGVMLTSHNILNNGQTIGDCMHFTSADRLLICVPLFHCFGCVLGVCSVITHGSTMVMVEDFDPLKVLASVHRERCTALHGVPTMFIAELNHPMFDMFDLSSLRTGIMAGAPCPIETMKQVMDKMYCKEIISVYGLTEASPGMTASRVTDSMEIRATTVGCAFPNVEVKVLDPATNKECPPGTPGEMCCKGYNIMKGYYKNPEATAAIIDENGFLHSGDLGVMDENGYFRITGRIKEMIIRGGENIYPREIENFLYKMPQIEAVEVAGIPSPKYGEEVGAFIKIKEGSSLTEEEVRLYCRGQIARYKIPKYIFFVDGYPMTASGKIQKYKLKDVGLRLLKEKGVEVI